MKTLALLRHAKAAPPEDYDHDHERPLNARGLRDAERIGRLLRERALVPQTIVTSPALRALMTAKTAAEACAFEGEVRQNPELYLASVPTLWEVVQGLDDALDSVMLVGHNPGIEDFLSALVNGDEHMPTACLAALRLDVDSWAKASRGMVVELLGLYKPKELE